MIMRKFMMTFAAVLCCTMIATVFTSCSKDDDDSNQAVYKYVAEGDITVTGSFTLGVADYQSAIDNALGNAVLTVKDDAKVVAACEAVYARHIAQYGNKIKGSVKVIRYKNGKDDATVIVEYTYNPQNF